MPYKFVSPSAFPRYLVLVTATKDGVQYKSSVFDFPPGADHAELTGATDDAVRAAYRDVNPGMADAVIFTERISVYEWAGPLPPELAGPIEKEKEERRKLDAAREASSPARRANLGDCLVVAPPAGGRVVECSCVGRAQEDLGRHYRGCPCWKSENDLPYPVVVPAPGLLRGK